MDQFVAGHRRSLAFGCRVAPAAAMASGGRDGLLGLEVGASGAALRSGIPIRRSSLRDGWRPRRRLDQVAPSATDAGSRRRTHRSSSAPAIDLPPDNRANIEAMAMCLADEELWFFAGTTDGHLYVSVDGAQSFSCAADGLPPVSKPTHIAILPGEWTGNVIMK